MGQCNAKVPPRMTPLKTKPAVDIPRGSEVRRALGAHGSVGATVLQALGSAMGADSSDQQCKHTRACHCPACCAGCICPDDSSWLCFASLLTTWSLCPQGALPSGTGSVPFACGVMALAGQLAAEPRVTLEVWHKERYAAVFLCSVLLMLLLPKR